MGLTRQEMIDMVTAGQAVSYGRPGKPPILITRLADIPDVVDYNATAALPRDFRRYGSGLFRKTPMQYLTPLDYNLSVSGDSGTSITPFRTPCDCHALEAVFQNWYIVPGTGDVAGPNSIIVKASLEYPNDTFYPLTFNGRNSVVIDPGGVVKCDPVDIDLPAGTMAYIRTYVNAGTTIATAAAGQFPRGASTHTANSIPGDTRSGHNYQSSASGAGTDQTATAGVAWKGAGFTAGVTNNGYGPTAVLAAPDSLLPVPTVSLYGDSIVRGLTDTPPNRGYVSAALIDAGIGYNKLALSGETTAQFAALSGSVRRMAWAESAEVAISGYGINDMGGGRTMPQIKADLISVWQRLAHRAQRVYQLTITPWTVSSDSWATAQNQTPQATIEVPFRVPFNNWLRDLGPTGAVAQSGGALTGFIDAVGQFEVNAAGVQTLNGGRWPGGTSNDGLHPNAAGVALLKAKVNTALFAPAL